MERGLQAAFKCESHVARIIGQQERNGVQFDMRRAKWRIYILEERKIDLYNKIRPMLNYEVESPYTVPVKKPFLKSGAYSKMVTDWYGDDSEIVWGAFTRIRFVEPDIGSRTKLIAQLLRLGWRPKHFTDPSSTYPEGSPKMVVNGKPCDSLNEIGTEEGQWIADWYIYQHRQSQIKGWVYGNKGNGFVSRIRSDGRIPAEAMTIGTNTFRFRHRKVVNVPKASPKVKFGKEMRELFIAAPGRVLVGHDASGLELRMLAHYLRDDTYTHAVVKGSSDDGTDVHTLNMVAAGLDNRDQAKTFIYALLYGAGDEKIGSIIGGGAKEGARIKAQFFAANPKWAELIDSVTESSKRGYLYGLDGRRIYMRRDKRTRQLQTHKALNTLLQCAGAVVMKYSMIFLDKWVRKEGLGVWKVIDMHDESQAEVVPEHVDRYKELARLSIIKAGEYLELNCPLDAEAKAGRNWAETH
jgi:hypothetical protein